MEMLSVIPIIVLLAVVVVFVKLALSGKLSAKALAVGVVPIILVGAVLVPTIGGFDGGREDLDVFVVMGQSNAATYRFDASQAEPVPSAGTAYYYGTPTDIIYWGSANPNNPQYDTSFESYGMHDMVKDGQALVGNIDLPFASEYYSLTGHKVYIINASIPSASIDIFQPGGIAYNYCKSVFSHAMDAINHSQFNVNVKGFIWVQGEQDYRMSVDEYKSKFMKFMDCLDWDSSHHFNKNYAIPSALICKVRVSDPNGAPSGINSINPSTAQIELANEHQNIYLATSLPDSFNSSNGTLYSDNHYSQIGDNMIGVAIAQYYFNNIMR